jgi:HSP20 family protein
MSEMIGTLEKKWNPINELDDLTTRMNRLFARAPWDGGRELFASADWIPSCNVDENETEYHVRAELPDVRKEDVHVRFENGVLTIEGERNDEKEEKNVKVLRREMSYGRFVRSFSMPDAIDESKVRAVFDKGMLNVTMAKMRAREPRAREIPVS